MTQMEILSEMIHGISTYNRCELQKTDVCGCFYCLHIYDPSEISEWIDTVLVRDGYTERRTALCAKCGIDSVIPFPKGTMDTDPDFVRNLLHNMQMRWFQHSVSLRKLQEKEALENE